MKELTIEQKAEAYDDALRIAQELYNNPNSSSVGKGYICTVFPALKESEDSEDEKIRKWLIALIKSNEYGSISNVGKMPCPKLNVLSWLEKQGQKETTWNKEDEENMNNILYVFNQLKDTSYYKEDDIAEKTINWLKSLKDRLCSNNEYDKDMLGAIEYCIKNNRPLEKEHISWLEKQGEKSIDDLTQQEAMDIAVAKCFEQGEQKPADKINPKFHEGDIVKPKDGGHEPWQIMQVDMFDKKYRFKDGYVIHFSQEDNYELVEQKPAWSEEDEVGLGDALLAIEQARTIAKDENDMGNLWYAEKWLKFLKERCTWKPTNEQMKALNDINLTGGISYAGQGQELINLYNDLKKLTK